MKRRERENEESIPLKNLAHPFLKALRKMCKYTSGRVSVKLLSGE